MMRIRIPCVALCLVALASACARTTTSPADDVLGPRIRAWAPDSSAVLASTQTSPLWSATQLVVDDTLTWRAIWQSIYANRFPAPPVPVVDFSAHSVLVYGLGAVYASLRFDSLTYYELGNAAYLTDTRPGAGCVVPAIVLAPVVAVATPGQVAVAKWYLRDVVQPCS